MCPSEAIGPECDPKLAVASILITGSKPLRCPQCNPLRLQTKMHRCFSGKRIAGSVSSNLQVVLPASFFRRQMKATTSQKSASDERSSPLVRGVAMGCSAHSIGTAGLISLGDRVRSQCGLSERFVARPLLEDTDAAAISGASMPGPC